MKARKAKAQPLEVTVHLDDLRSALNRFVLVDMQKFMAHVERARLEREWLESSLAIQAAFADMKEAQARGELLLPHLERIEKLERARERNYELRFGVTFTGEKVKT